MRIYHWAMPPPLNCEKSGIWLNHTTLEKLPQWKITKIVATRLQILGLKCTKFDLGYGLRGPCPFLNCEKSRIYQSINQSFISHNNMR